MFSVTLTLEFAFSSKQKKLYAQKKKKKHIFLVMFLKQQFEATWKNPILKIMQNLESVVVKCSDKNLEILKEKRLVQRNNSRLRF